jgi:hypothetical protein
VVVDHKPGQLPRLVLPRPRKWPRWLGHRQVLSLR